MIGTNTALKIEDCSVRLTVRYNQIGYDFAKSALANFTDINKNQVCVEVEQIDENTYEIGLQTAATHKKAAAMLACQFVRALVDPSTVVLNIHVDI